MFTAKWYNRIEERDSARILKHLRETQFWCYEKIREYQFKKLLKLLEHAYSHVPYYRRCFEVSGAMPQDIRSFDDFAAIMPILTKGIIRENIEDLISDNVPKSSLTANATGGSTGEPLSFYQDYRYDVWQHAAMIRGWYEIAGCSFGDCCGVVWGDMHEIKEDFTFAERLKVLLKYGVIPLNAFNLSEKRKLLFLKWCNMLRPKLLRGYVTAITDLANFLAEREISLPYLQGVILCAETVDEATQKYIERVFRVPSYNTYGSRELSLIAMECPSKNGLHEISENNYVEFEHIDLEGYDNAGNLIITNLNNYGMPFIRYRIGDIGVPNSLHTCDCGRGLPLIDKIIGRTTEVFLFHDGTRIAGEMFIHLMKDFPIREYQFVQVSDAIIVLYLKKSDCVSEQVRKSIEETYKKYLPDNVILQFEEVDKFDKTPTGKFRFVLKGSFNQDHSAYVKP
jgi:phenylacetate-CoA ligase